ncbi:Keratin-associated protein 4-3-like 1, partial [Homarus americanus]
MGRMWNDSLSEGEESLSSSYSSSENEAEDVTASHVLTLQHDPEEGTQQKVAGEKTGEPSQIMSDENDLKKSAEERDSEDFFNSDWSGEFPDLNDPLWESPNKERSKTKSAKKKQHKKKRKKKKKGEECVKKVGDGKLMKNALKAFLHQKKMYRSTSKDKRKPKESNSVWIQPSTLCGPEHEGHQLSSEPPISVCTGESATLSSPVMTAPSKELEYRERIKANMAKTINVNVTNADAHTCTSNLVTHQHKMSDSSSGYASNKPQSTFVSATSERTSAAILTSERPSAAILTSERTSAAILTSERPSAAILTSEKPSAAILTSERTSAAILTSEKPSAAILTSERPSAAILTSERPSAAILTSERPSAAILTSERPSVAILTSERPSAAILTSERPSAAILTSERPSAAILTSERPSAAILTSERPSVAILTSERPSAAILTSERPSAAILTSERPSAAILTSERPSAAAAPINDEKNVDSEDEESSSFDSDKTVAFEEPETVSRESNNLPFIISKIETQKNEVSHAVGIASNAVESNKRKWHESGGWEGEALVENRKKLKGIDSFVPMVTLPSSVLTSTLFPHSALSGTTEPSSATSCTLPSPHQDSGTQPPPATMFSNVRFVVRSPRPFHKRKPPSNARKSIQPKKQNILPLEGLSLTLANETNFLKSSPETTVSSTLPISERCVPKVERERRLEVPGKEVCLDTPMELCKRYSSEILAITEKKNECDEKIRKIREKCDKEIAAEEVKKKQYENRMEQLVSLMRQLPSTTSERPS